MICIFQQEGKNDVENYSFQSRVGTNAAPLLHHLSSRDLKPLPSHRQDPWLSLV